MNIDFSKVLKLWKSHYPDRVKIFTAAGSITKKLLKNICKYSRFTSSKKQKINLKNLITIIFSSLFIHALPAPNYRTAEDAKGILTGQSLFDPDYILTLAVPKTELFQNWLSSQIYLADIGIPEEIYRYY